MTQQLYTVEAFWDRQAQVWVAQSDDVPGLATEADSIESLTNKLRQMIPELLQLNNLVPAEYVGDISFELISHRQESIKIAS